MTFENNILILGLGSEILKDDGIGPKLTKDLSAYFTAKQFHFKTSPLGGLEIIELIKGYRVVFIIDGIKTNMGKPGKVYFMDLNDYKETLHLSSFHDTTFDIALKLAKDVGEPIPESIYIIGIEIQEDTVFGDSLTEELQASYLDILKSVHDFILRIFNA